MHILISAVSSAKAPSGICRHAANLASSLKDMREISRVTLLVGRWQRSYYENAFHLHGSGVGLISADLRNTAGSRNFWYHQTLPAIAHALRADLVHLSFPVPVKRQKFSCPVVCSRHDMYAYDIPRNFGLARAIFNRMFLRNCIRESDFVVCSSDFTLARLRTFLPGLAGGKAVRIYPIVGLSRSTPRGPQPPQLFGRPFLLVVAQHRKNKNLSLMIEAFAKIRAQRAELAALRLIIVGSDGPETKHLQRQVRRRWLAEHVRFTKDLTDEELCWLYQQCEATLVSSTIEGFCLPLAEAQQYGARLVCPDIPVLREVGGAACQFFKLTGANPVSGLARSIVYALHAPKPLPLISQRFAPREIAGQHVALYRRLLSGATEERTSPLGGVGAASPEKYAV